MPAAKWTGPWEAGAMAIGAEVEITNSPGYMPRVDCPPLSNLFRDECRCPVRGGCSRGDRPQTQLHRCRGLSQLIPTIHPYVNGAEGSFHSSELTFVDEDLAYVMPAKLLGMTLIDLLCEGAKRLWLVKLVINQLLPKTATLAAWEELVAK